MHSRRELLERYLHSREEPDSCNCNSDYEMNSEGYKVCSGCGSVVEGSNIVQYERRAYNRKEVNERRRTEMVRSEYGGRTLIKKYDLKHHLAPEKKRLFHRLRRINNGSSTSKGRSLSAAARIRSVTESKLHLPSIVEESAWRVYKKAKEKSLIHGRGMNEVLGASVHVALRYHNIIRYKEEVCNAFQISKKDLYRNISILKKEVLPCTNYDYKWFKTKDYFIKAWKDLKWSESELIKVLNESSALFEDDGLDELLIGKDARVTAGALLYAYGKEKDKKITQEKIGEKVRITELALRERYYALKNKGIMKIFSNTRESEFTSAAEYVVKGMKELGLEKRLLNLVKKYESLFEENKVEKALVNFEPGDIAGALLYNYVKLNKEQFSISEVAESVNTTTIVIRDALKELKKNFG